MKKNNQFEDKLLNTTPSDKLIQTDPQGSYTGRPKDPCETPVQDADDL